MNVFEVKHVIHQLIETYQFGLVGLLDSSGRIFSTSREAAALAKLVESELISLIKNSLEAQGFVVNEGGERTYPDTELITPDGSIIALDIKCASYKPNATKMNSRLTLYTFGTYLTNRDIKDGTLRPYDEYDIHLDLVAFYQVNPRQEYLVHDDIFALEREDLNQLSYDHGPFREMYFCVVEPWRVASHRMSSGTRDYVGAVMDLERFRNEQGVFRSKQAFYNFWGNVPAQLRDLHRKIFGNSKKKQPPSHCYIEQLAELLDEDVRNLYLRVIEDEGFPCFSPDPNTKFANLEKVITIDDSMLFYPRIVFNYLGCDPIVNDLEVEIALGQILSRKW
ncbi:hypothetical protein HRE53_18795 [Acaryochloris sp. 'Moss Beach']|uniref:EcoRV family type II restriction endonuclease n=1 Tax=Acaryochloris sp. 'Moss Beach' TaxID=2740837 RepID=UPI001F27A071|nr:EcoRV family type II restriction endonuclease [Acaryochloris sp. 'Moss Beach']UJB68546.1 hypothetical protein HRE53_18795 [Acaryochloris sp. 'Moss Beach']